MITFSGKRHRSVSATSTGGPKDEELRSLVNALSDTEDDSFQDLQLSLEDTGILQRLRHTLIDQDDPREVKNAFRRVQGFQALLSFLRTYCGIYKSAELTGSERKEFFSSLKEALTVLGTSLQDHAGNQKYFTKEINGGGWQDLENILAFVSERLSQENTDTRDVELFYGMLFATAVGEEVLADIYTTLRKTSESTTKSGEDGAGSSAVESLRESCRRSLHSVEVISNPDLLTVLLKLWSAYQLGPNAKDGNSRVLDQAIPASLLELVSTSRHNVVAAHTAGLLTAVLPLLVNTSHNKIGLKLFRDLAIKLCEEGVPDLNDAYTLYSRAKESSESASFLLKAIQASRKPPNIHFDLSSHGYCSVELPTLSRKFPPLDTGGYTLAVWARFDRFDINSHTTIFGAFDASQTCFLLAYLEKDTRQFILQTSIRGSRPSVRFKTFVFEEGQWYHICIVHKKPRTTSSSRAYLFVNGEFIEQLKAGYPSTPPAESTNRTAQVQAFFGTPQDLAPNLAKGACTSRWSLASSTLFGEALSDDLITVFYHLGPRYHGNFQDCLGSFQTYSASAALNLRNETLNPAKQDNSDIVLAIRQKASNLIPEASILLNISPSAILDSDDRNNIDESQLVKSLSKFAAKNLQQYTRSGSNAVAINGAVPAINDALTQAHGVAILAGDPVVATPQSLDDASWRMGGCAAVGLPLADAAKTTEEVCLAVEILLELVQNNWRNSEAMERENGYSILATILRMKLGLVNNHQSSKPSPAIPTATVDRNEMAFRLLRLVLAFVGYDIETPRNSVINNPLAYRVLLVDTDIWRSGAQAVQELYFNQFITFGMESQHYRFNAKRLARMRVLKKLLDALKSEAVLADTMPLYMTAFKSLLPTAISAEMLRSLALFITYSVHSGKPALQHKKSSKQALRSRHSTGSESTTSEAVDQHLSRFQIGVEVLRLYSDFLCAKDDAASIRKFAKTVTNKWLLYLMSETSPEVVVLSTRILARLVVVHGSAYLTKFKDKSGGINIMRHRLKRWWHLPALWPACFAILFGIDVGTLDLDRSFDLFGLLELFDGGKEVKVKYPEILEVMTGMLQSGLKTIVNSRLESTPNNGLTPEAALSNAQPRQRLSMSTMSPPDPFLVVVADHHVETLNTVIRFMADLHSRSQNYRDFAASSSYVQDLLFVLFPVVVGSDTVSADVELNARDSALTFDGQDVLIRPLSSAPPIVRTANLEPQKSPARGQHLRRGSSFVLVASEQAKHQPSSSRLHQSISPISPTGRVPQLNDGHAIVQSLLEIVISVFTDQILVRKDFSGLGLFLRTPPGFLEHQSYFESWILRNTLSQLSNAILLNQKVLWEPKVITNLARLFSHVGEASYEGWFIGGADPALDFAGSILEYLQRPDIASIKNVRLCSQAISVIRAVVFRTVILSLSQVEGPEVLPFLQKLTYWQTVLLASEEAQSQYLPLICYLLYASLISAEHNVRMAAANLWRIILVQKPEEASAMFNQATSTEHHRLAASFEKLLELDNETFLYWVDDHRHDLDSFFFEVLSKSWDQFTAEENKKTDEGARQRIVKRQEKLKQWRREETDKEDLIRRHEVTFDHWTSNIYASELQKHQRVMQDHQDNVLFTMSSFERMQRDAKGPLGFLAEGRKGKWRLDQTEGRNRMRLRLKPESDASLEEFQPRRKGSEAPLLRVDTRVSRVSTAEAVGVTPGGFSPTFSSPQKNGTSEPFPDLPEESANDENVDVEESFELVEDPQVEQEDYEDRNRKVMRSLNRGDQVKQVANISRIAGLEAIEGLLILGKNFLYLIDNYFQRADGEIVNVWQAPQQERDPYVRMISGRETTERKTTARSVEHETRSWKWSDIISVSKRRFLFRDVAIELFFADGRSYLLTVMSPAYRNELHGAINSKAPQYVSGQPLQSSENLWRFESLRSPEEEPRSIGSKFANVFGQMSSTPATRRWQKGEISNFHYLMLINTMAGRTYNDLTQYPVFPWILADYTSEELDISDPKTFRDLSKPMGCQTTEREADFKERYKSFAEMGDHNSPPFHYGTHYSSAMIVTSYLIRLQPFVKSYLLLQGGSFDHPDRMFYSIEKAWNSASRMNMTDVRELTPEFYNLPEFLTNVNGYDFGSRQNSTKSIDQVELPPWAKGDPKIFIAKHREALESPFVSHHLHKWIDLVFGCKQRGEPAVDAVNVFHHLSYQGAKDLDNISDPVERLATIGIIHNFGQTPYQVFQKPHPGREETRHKYKRLDTAAESLTRLPFNLLDSEERVSSLLFSWKQERLLCSAAFRLNMPPGYDKYMEWGFSDGSIRFYSAESRKLIGHFEHLHIGQLSCGKFADSKTLITAGTDCTIAVWDIISSSKTVDIQPKSSLFGHRTPVNVLALSQSFNALLSASTDGEVLQWDLNRLEFVREVDKGLPVDCASINDVTGNIVLCRGSRITMYTLNGALILDQDAGDRADDTIISCACYEGAGNEWLERDILFTGHKRGIVKVWSKVIRDNKFELELIRQLNHVDVSREDGGNVTAGISCILPMPQVVYTGDEDGRVCEWDCVQRH